MELSARIQKFIEHPFPLWETELTQQLIQHKWTELRKLGLNSLGDYSTARAWFKNPALEQSKKIAVAENNRDTVYIEYPSFNFLGSFHNEHGLEPLNEAEIESNSALSK